MSNAIAVAKEMVEAAFTIERQHLPLEKAELDLVRAYINLTVKAIEVTDVDQMVVTDGDEADREKIVEHLKSTMHLPAVIASRLLVTLESLGFKNS